MSDPVSALGGASFDGYVRIEEQGPCGMITLRGALASDAVKSAVSKVTGVEVPGQREIRLAGERGAAWMSPDELLILVPHGEADQAVASLAEALGDAHALAVNVSDARAVFRLTGGGVREVVAKLAPVDMAAGAFGPGMIRRTRLAQVPAAFWMRDASTVELVCFRSVARYVFDLLSTAARKGSEVGLG
jgi:sarcosine oxidase subunit gamma